MSAAALHFRSSGLPMRRPRLRPDHFAQVRGMHGQRDLRRVKVNSKQGRIRLNAANVSEEHALGKTHRQSRSPPRMREKGEHLELRAEQWMSKGMASEKTVVRELCITRLRKYRTNGSRPIANHVPLSGHPCFMPLVMMRVATSCPSSRVVLMTLVYKAWMM